MSYRKSSDQINRPMFSARWPARAPRGGNGGTANMTLPPAFLKQKAEGPPSLSPQHSARSPGLADSVAASHVSLLLSSSGYGSQDLSPTVLHFLPYCPPRLSSCPVQTTPRGEGEPAGHSPPQFASSSSLWGPPHSQAHTEREATPWLPGSPLLTYRVTCGQRLCLPCLQLCLREHDVSSAHTY